MGAEPWRRSGGRGERQGGKAGTGGSGRQAVGEGGGRPSKEHRRPGNPASVSPLLAKRRKMTYLQHEKKPIIGIIIMVCKLRVALSPFKLQACAHCLQRSLVTNETDGMKDL